MRAKPLDSVLLPRQSLFFETPRCTEERLIYRNCSSDAINLLRWNSTHTVVNPQSLFVAVHNAGERRFYRDETKKRFYSLCVLLCKISAKKNSRASRALSQLCDIRSVLDFGMQRRKWRIQSTRKDIVTRRRRTRHTT